MTAYMKSSNSEQQAKVASPPDLMSINIEGLVKDARVDSSPSSSPSDEAPHPATEEAQRETDNPQWDVFEKNLRTYKKKVEKTPRSRQYAIDENIVDVLELCTFGKNSLTNVVNAILLTFIQEHKARLRTLLKPTPSLIQ